MLMSIKLGPVFKFELFSKFIVNYIHIRMLKRVSFLPHPAPLVEILYTLHRALSAAT